MSYDNTNRFAVWPNTKRRPDKNDAHWTGTLNVDGKEYWINVWKKADNASEGAPSLSGSIRPKEPRQESAPPSAPVAEDNGFSDEIPFAPRESF